MVVVLRKRRVDACFVCLECVFASETERERERESVWERKRGRGGVKDSGRVFLDVCPIVCEKSVFVCVFLFFCVCEGALGISCFAVVCFSCPRFSLAWCERMRSSFHQISSSQGYGKPVSSGLCRRISERQQKVLKLLVCVQLSSVRGTLYSWPSCTLGFTCIGF